MLISNSYSLEYKYEKTKGLFQKLHIAANVFKIVTLCLAVISFWQVWTLIGVVISFGFVIALTMYKQRIFFTYRYTVSNGILTIKKIDINGKETVKEEFNVINASNVSIVDKIDDSGEVYFSEKSDDTDLIIKVDISKRYFFMLSDKYMYSLLTYTKEKNGIS